MDNQSKQILQTKDNNKWGSDLQIFKHDISLNSKEPLFKSKLERLKSSDELTAKCVVVFVLCALWLAGKNSMH